MAQALTPLFSPCRFLSASSWRGCCGSRCVQKLPCPGRGGLGRSEWDPIQMPSLSIYLLRPACVASQVVGRLMGPPHSSYKWEGGGTSWQQGPLALSRVTSGSPLGPAMWEGGINTADRIWLRVRQGESRWGGGVPVETRTHTYTCGHTHVRALQPARPSQLPHHFPDCMETVELVNP